MTIANGGSIFGQGTSKRLLEFAIRREEKLHFFFSRERPTVVHHMGKHGDEIRLSQGKYVVTPHTFELPSLVTPPEGLSRDILHKLHHDYPPGTFAHIPAHQRPASQSAMEWDAPDDMDHQEVVRRAIKTPPELSQLGRDLQPFGLQMHPYRQPSRGGTSRRPLPEIDAPKKQRFFDATHHVQGAYFIDTQVRSPNFISKQMRTNMGSRHSPTPNRVRAQLIASSPSPSAYARPMPRGGFC
mmetsp:Transcript_55829/g.132024  ORF Transcript_55829/g.132024 Transcript_55829/m.132024 type:complete len:241 (+) Transcript_55829:3-725(+)